MNELLRTLAASTGALGLTGVLSPVVMVQAAMNETAADGTLHFWGKAMLAVAGVKHEARGLENLPPGNFVMCCNHQSNFDPLVLFAHVRRHMRYIAKAELLKIPLLGQALKAAGNVFIDRSGGDADRQILANAIEAVQHRVSIVFFAEGTRSYDGVLKPFKKGAAVFAIDAQVPLVPAAIAGTFDIMPKGRLAIRARPAALVVGKPIETKGMTAADRESLTARLQSEVATLLAEGNAMCETLR